MSNKIESLLEKANSNGKDESSVSFAKRVFSDSDQAQRMFLQFSNKLLDLKVWNICTAETTYELFDENGVICRERILFEGAFIRLSMKGSGKNDWVRVVKIYETADEKIITVKPAADPTEKGNGRRISHFFGSAASNNFCLLRHDQSITFYVIGLREKQNTSETGGIIETLRNIAVANIGFYSGIQKAEWKTFCKNFLNPKG